MRQLVNTVLISNNRASFQFWWTKNLLHQRVSKYYENVCRSRIPDAWSVKIIVLLIVKTENRTKKSLTQLSYYCFEKRYYFCQKNANLLLKKITDMSEIMRLLVLKDIFFKTRFVCSYVPNFKFLAQFQQVFNRGNPLL